MRFTIELVASTGDSDRYRVAGYLASDESEKDLMSEMIEDLKISMSKGSDDFSHYLLFKDNKIIYNDIPIVTCSNILKLFRDSFKIDIITETASNAKYIPADCRQLFQMELNRLFN